MGKRLVMAPVAGFAAALAIGGFASASGPTIAADTPAPNAWKPSTAAIHVGDTVTWTNDGGFHNVHVVGDANALVAAGPGWTSVQRTFTQPGTHTFYCEVHGNPDGTGMSGTITVTADSTGTSTTGPEPVTDTITVPTPTDMTPAAPDTTAPAFSGKPKRRASRRALVLEVGSSEAGTLQTTVLRRPPRGHAYSRVTDARLKVTQGKNVVTVPRASVRRGSYRVKLQLVDAAGNRSATRTLSFKVS
jgi:plastocyanin